MGLSVWLPPSLVLKTANNTLIGKVWIYHSQFVCFLFVCLSVQLRISPPTIKLAASNFAGQFIRVRRRKSPIFVNFAHPEAQNRMKQPVRERRWMSTWWLYNVPTKFMRRVDVGSACVDIHQSLKTDVLVQISFTVANKDYFSRNIWNFF